MWAGVFGRLDELSRTAVACVPSSSCCIAGTTPAATIRSVLLSLLEDRFSRAEAAR